MCNFQDQNVSSLSIFGNRLTLQTAYGNFLMLYQMVLLLNINFLISKQNKKPKINLKCWSSSLVLLFLEILYSGIAIFYTSKQSCIIKYNYCKQINEYICSYELHLCSGLILFWYQWYTEQFFMFGMYLFPLSII